MAQAAPIPVPEPVTMPTAFFRSINDSTEEFGDYTADVSGPASAG
jgi:hypothetical protein